MERRQGLGTDEEPIIQTFSLDGKENTNPDDRGRGEFKSKAKWGKSNLVIEGVQRSSFGGRDLEMRLKEDLSLSKDGRVLTIKTSITTPNGPITVKQTFKKEE
jgi:hypothetical protein